jgi:RNase adaptor protein for sRNA GlmZ degradation
LALLLAPTFTNPKIPLIAAQWPHSFTEFPSIFARFHRRNEKTGQQLCLDKSAVGKKFLLPSQYFAIIFGMIKKPELIITTFGRAYGPFEGADLLYDVRNLPDPQVFWVNLDRAKSGLDEKVSDFVFADQKTKDVFPKFVEEIRALLEKSTQPVKVAVANRLTQVFRNSGYEVTLNHRERNNW